MENELCLKEISLTQIQNKILMKKANYTRLHLLQIIKEELELKKFESNIVFVNTMKDKIIEIESSDESKKKTLKINIDSDDESYEEEGNSSNDISCEEEEIQNFKKF